MLQLVCAYFSGEGKTNDDVAESDNVVASADSSKQPEASEGQSGPMLSPTSLKNPRMRKFSMGVEPEEEEVADENAEDEFFVKYKN